MNAPSRLTRSRGDRIAGGVCAGLARELGVDTAIVRVGAVLLAIFGIGLVLYAALMLVVPEEGQADPLLKRAIDGDDRPLAAGLALVCVVGVASFDGPFGWMDGRAWPIAFVSASAAAIAVGYARRGAGAPSAAEGPVGATGDVRVPDLAQDAAVGTPSAAEGSLGATAGDVRAPDLAVGEEPTTPMSAATAAVPPRGSAPGRHAGVAAALALGVALLAFAVAGAFLVLFGVQVGWDVVLAGAVVVVGILLLVAAPFGGARALVPFGLALAAVAGVAAAADLELRGGVGERTYRPTSAAQLDAPYELSAGRLELDLRDLPLAAGGTPVRVQVGFGEVVVRVPEDAPVHVTARAAGGDLNVLGQDENGVDVEADVDDRGRGPATSARLDLDAQVGFGEITVVRGDEDVDVARREARFALTGVWR